MSTCVRYNLKYGRSNLSLEEDSGQCKTVTGLRNSQGASALILMPLMKSCLLPCQQDRRCCCSPHIQHCSVKQTATNLVDLNKKWLSGAASANTNVGQPLQKPNTASVSKGRSQFSLLYDKAAQAAPTAMDSVEKSWAFVLNLSMCLALIPNPRDKKKGILTQRAEYFSCSTSFAACLLLPEHWDSWLGD